MYTVKLSIWRHLFNICGRTLQCPCVVKVFRFLPKLTALFSYSRNFKEEYKREETKFYSCYSISDNRNYPAMGWHPVLGDSLLVPRVPADRLQARPTIYTHDVCMYVLIITSVLCLTSTLAAVLIYYTVNIENSLIVLCYEVLCPLSDYFT